MARTKEEEKKLKANEEQVEIPSGPCPAARCSLSANLVIGKTFISVFKVILCCEYVKTVLGKESI